MFEDAVKQLQHGDTVVIKPRGTSMTPKVRSGQSVKLVPVTSADDIDKGDVVLARVGSVTYLHFAKTVEKSRVQIGNGRGHINGWTPIAKVFGKLVR